MSPWRLKSRYRLTVGQAKPLVFRRENNHWILASGKNKKKKGRYQGNEGMEEQPDYC